MSFGGGGSIGNGINNVAPQFSQNPLNSVGFNSRPNYSGPFPTLPSAVGGGYLNQQQFGGAPLPNPYLTLYGGNNNVAPQMLPYYGQFRPFQGGQGSGGFGAYGSGSLMPLSTRFQTNLQFGQQPSLFTALGANSPTLFDRMDTEKQSDEQVKKSTQQ